MQVQGLTRKIFKQMKERVRQDREEKKRKEERKRPPPEWLHGTMQGGTASSLGGSIGPPPPKVQGYRKPPVEIKSRTVYVSEEVRREKAEKEEYEALRKRKQDARDRRRKEGRRRIGLDYLSLLKTLDAAERKGGKKRTSSIEESE